MLYYDTCRWCKYFCEGLCVNKQAFSPQLGDLNDLLENGTLKLLIEETIGEIKLKEFETNLNKSKLTKKAQKEFLQNLSTELTTVVFDLVDKLDEAIFNKLHGVEIVGLEIVNPNEFSCKYFM